MPDPQNAVSGLASQLQDLRARYPACDVSAVAEVVRAVLATMSGQLTATEVLLLAEVRELGSTVARTRAELAAMRMDDITSSHIPAASDELDAVLTHTAAATNAILEECEALDGLASDIETTKPDEEFRAKAGATLQHATMRIYESCSFQDLTGQRISKVVAALQAIDVRIARILAVTDGAPRSSEPPVVNAAERALAETLMHGPQLPENAMKQDDIDQLLAAL